MERGLLSSQLQTKRVFFCVLAPDLFFGGPIVFKYMICLSIAIQNAHLMRYIISLNTHTISLRLPPLIFTIHIHISFSLSLSLSLSRGRVCWLRSRLRLLLYVMVLCCRRPLSLCLSLSLNGHNSHHTHNLYIPPSHDSIALNVVQKLHHLYDCTFFNRTQVNILALWKKIRVTYVYVSNGKLSNLHHI